jgi:hypothetical protein
MGMYVRRITSRCDLGRFLVGVGRLFSFLQSHNLEAGDGAQRRNLPGASPIDLGAGQGETEGI